VHSVDSISSVSSPFIAPVEKPNMYNIICSFFLLYLAYCPKAEC
jgi:hypothetical protein